MSAPRAGAPHGAALLTALLLALAGGMGCAPTEESSAPAAVHVGNAVEVGGAPRWVRLVVGEEELSLKAFPWDGRTVVGLPPVAQAQATTWTLREEDGAVIRDVVPVAHHVAGAPGDRTRQALEVLTRFMEVDVAPSAEARPAWEEARTAARELLPYLRASVDAARTGQALLDEGDADVPAVVLDRAGLQVLDRLLDAAAEPVVALRSSDPAGATQAARSALSSQAERSLGSQVAEIALVGLVLYALPQVITLKGIVIGTVAVATMLGTVALVLHAPAIKASLDASTAKLQQATSALGGLVKSGATALGARLKRSRGAAALRWLSSATQKLLQGDPEETCPDCEPQPWCDSACSGQDICRICGSAALCGDVQAECCNETLCGPTETCVAGTCVAQQAQCSSQQTAGGDAPETRVIELGRSSGTFLFTFNTYSQQDRIVVSYEGTDLFDTGCVGLSDEVQIGYQGRSTQVMVAVTPNCAGGSGTAWDFTVSCPQ